MADLSEQVEAACLDGKYEDAAKLAAESGEGHDPKLALAMLQTLLRNPLRDLEADSHTRERVRASIAASFLLSETYGQAGRRLLRLLGGPPPCSALVEWLRDPYGEGDIDPDDGPDPHSIAEYYCWRRLAEIDCEQSLRELIESPRVGRGILIQAAPNAEEFRPCANGDIETPWDRLIDLPRLPCGWGCRCGYSALI
jgi:hypothetical protein